MQLGPLTPMHICPRCHGLIFDEPHRCPPRWIALVDEGDTPEGQHVDPDNFTVIDNLYADCEEGAATDAAQRFAYAARGHDEEGTVFVGVMRYDEYQQWKERLSADTPGTFTIPIHELCKFEVE